MPGRIGHFGDSSPHFSPVERECSEGVSDGSVLTTKKDTGRDGRGETMISNLKENNKSSSHENIKSMLVKKEMVKN